MAVYTAITITTVTIVIKVISANEISDISTSVYISTAVYISVHQYISLISVIRQNGPNITNRTQSTTRGTRAHSQSTTARPVGRSTPIWQNFSHHAEVANCKLGFVHTGAD